MENWVDIKKRICMKNYEEVKNQAVNGRIYCNCDYEWKENLKKLGFRWSPELKLWYINIMDFTEDIYNKTQKVRLTTNTPIGDKHYYYVNYETKAVVERKATSRVYKVNKFDFANYAF